MAKIKPSTLFTGTLVFLAIVLITSVSHIRGPVSDSIASYMTKYALQSPNSSSFSIPAPKTWPHIIWQTSKLPFEKQDDQDRSLAATWASLNPLYRHEMLTHEHMLGYVADHFHTTHPALEQLYLDTKDYMLRTDILRFLLLLVEGGIYADLDVTCLQPIDTWLDPPSLAESVGLVLGVEFDNDLGPPEITSSSSSSSGGSSDDDDKEVKGTPLFQLASWTIAAKPNHPFLHFLIDDLIARMSHLTPDAQTNLSMQGVLDTTGPAALTNAFLEYATQLTGTEVTRANFSRIEKPVVLAGADYRAEGQEVVMMVLPVWAFGAEHQVRNSGFEVGGEGRRALVKHHFRNSWKGDHP